MFDYFTTMCFPVLMDLCGQGRGSGSSPGKMLPCSCSMYPSWSLFLIWSWILIRLRYGETMSPVQTFRIPAEPKRRRQVRITPSEILKKKKNKKSINASEREFTLRETRDTIYSQSQKKLRFTLDTKRWAKAKNTSFGSPNTTCYTWKHSTALYCQVYVKKKEKKN